MVDDVHESDLLPTLPWVNLFELNEAAPSYIFVAGGIGITPILSMMRHLTHQGRTDFKLYYCTRDAEGTAFKDELNAPEFAGLVKLHHDHGDPSQALDLWPIFERPTSFPKLFEKYLTEHNLLIDPITNKERVLYCLRHTYATIALERDRVLVHTLAKQMGTSVKMIEQHYSHLDAVKAIDQLRGEESLALLQDHTHLDDRYTYKPENKIGRHIGKTPS